MQVDGNVNVMLINKDPSVTYHVAVSLPALRVHGVAVVFSYGIDSTSISSSIQPVHGSSFTVTVPPYSLTAVSLP